MLQDKFGYMKTIFLLLNTCFMIPSILSAQSPELDQQFLELENEWMNAWKNKDEKRCREILADDFTLTSSLSSGNLMTKEQWIGALTRYDCKSFSFDKVKTRQYGNTVVVNSWYHQEAIANGAEWNGTFVITDVWVKNNGHWQVVTRHASWLDKP